MSVWLQNLRCLRASAEQSWKRLLQPLPGQHAGLYMVLFLIYQAKIKKRTVLLADRCFRTNLHSASPSTSPNAAKM